MTSERDIREAEAFIKEYGPCEYALERYIASLGALRLINELGESAIEDLMRRSGMSDDDIVQELDRQRKDLGILLGANVPQG